MSRVAEVRRGPPRTTAKWCQNEGKRGKGENRRKLKEEKKDRKEKKRRKK